MNRYVIYSGTLTHAIKGRETLKKSGYKAFVERRTADIGKYGCGYAIICIAEDIASVQSILQNSGVKILKIIKE